MNNVIIAMSIGLGIVLLYGIYKMATSNMHESSHLRPEEVVKRRQTWRTVWIIFFSILAFLALYTTYEIFVNQ